MEKLPETSPAQIKPDVWATRLMKLWLRQCKFEAPGTDPLMVYNRRNEEVTDLSHKTSGINRLFADAVPT
jgi:hypothetical protein